MALNIMFLVRGAQALLAVLVLILCAYTASTFGTAHWTFSPSQVNYLIFVSIWTLLVLAYLFLSPKYLAKFAHPYIFLALEALTMLFWFSGFISVAVFFGHFVCDYDYDSDLYDSDFESDFDSDYYSDVEIKGCGAGKGAAAVGAALWLLFVYTVVRSALTLWKERKGAQGVDAQTSEVPKGHENA